MKIEKVLESIKNRSEVINDHLWYVNPNDIEEVLEVVIQTSDSVKHHICTESPCPVLDEECVDILENGFTTTHTLPEKQPKTIANKENKGIELKLTCSACPEQYEAFLDGKKVGYLRLRNGWFRVDYPDCGGETIYETYPKGDGFFEDDERDFYLNEAKKAILERIRAEENKGIDKRLLYEILKEATETFFGEKPFYAVLEDIGDGRLIYKIKYGLKDENPHSKSKM